MAVDWSPDGKRLATGGRDGKVQVFALDVQDLIALARRLVSRNLSIDECKKYLHRKEIPPIPF